MSLIRLASPQRYPTEPIDMAEPWNNPIPTGDRLAHQLSPSTVNNVRDPRNGGATRSVNAMATTE